VVRVLPDVSGIDKEFDYLVPDHLPEVIVGSVVRVDLAGRRVAGWRSSMPPWSSARCSRWCR
jgi:primosomal protein N' (replication factor Y)